MLTNLASYLLGYLEPAAAPADSAEARLSPNPSPPSADTPVRQASLPDSEDEDWLLVEAAGIENEENPRVVRLSRSASTSSLPTSCPGTGAGMEESWFVTPPPCFTCTPPAGLDPSPLETLLIEHPSMSVYHPHVHARARSASPPHGAPAPAPAPLPPRQPLATVNEQQALRCLELKAAAKYQKKQSLQVNRNQLERSNKAREVASRSRRQRRSDRQLQHSGANNNRKCC